MSKGVVLYIVTLMGITTNSYISPQCPEMCLCSENFTDCKFRNFSKLPLGLDPNVTTLDLAFNNFQVFPEDLNNYPTLKYLNLSHNRIATLREKAFRNLKNLQVLDLTHNMINDWTSIQSKTFTSAKNLTVLDLSHNFLGNLPREETPLHSNSLKILHLTNCSIEFLSNKILEKSPNLQELHLSQNPIRDLRSDFVSHSLKFLDLSRCNLQKISSTVFRNLTSLQTIYMQQNVYLKKFSCDSESLLFLDLSDCNLEVIPSGHLPNVYKANFHGNHFRTIPKFSFENYPKIQLLDLSYNAISSIEENAFASLEKLEKLDLSLNTLTSLNRDLFASNKNLKFLNLSRNYFSKVQYFQSDSLQNLDMSVCEIQLVDTECLIDMPSLTVLNLSKNIISILPENWESISLNRLDLSLCRIKNVNNKTFTAMPSLRQINLAGNRLTSASPESFAQVISLDISDNPWRCDCALLKPLYTWLSKTGKNLNGLYCQSPEMYEGMSWVSVCQKEWHPELSRSDSVWWYTVGLIITVFVILFAILAMRRMYLLKEKRIREADQARRNEERETLRRMQRMQAEAREEVSRNAPDPRELQTPPSYNEALLLPRLDSSHPSLAGSLHSITSKYSLNGSNPDISKRSRTRRKRRRRKSDSSEGQRASRVVVDSDTSDTTERPQPRATLESDF